MLSSNLIQTNTKLVDPRQRLAPVSARRLIVATPEGLLRRQPMICRFRALQGLERLVVGLLPPPDSAPIKVRGFCFPKSRVRATTYSSSLVAALAVATVTTTATTEALAVVVKRTEFRERQPPSTVWATTEALPTTVTSAEVAAARVASAGPLLTRD